MDSMTGWKGNKFVIKQKVLSIGRKFYIYDDAGNLIGFSKQKIMKLKEDIRIYTDDNESDEITSIMQQQVLDFSGNFKITDSRTGATLGFIARQGLKSIFRDTWRILGPNEEEIGLVKEEGGALAVVRRLSSIANIIPKKYNVTSNGKNLVHVAQRFQFIGDTWDITIQEGCDINKHLIVSSALLMDIVEQSQGS